jgi:hypothetical protein
VAFPFLTEAARSCTFSFKLILVLDVPQGSDVDDNLLVFGLDAHPFDAQASGRDSH